MGEQTLQTRLDRIERLLYLVLVLAAGPYVFGVAEVVGYWTAGVVGAALAVVAFAAVASSRRRDRSVTGQ